MTFAPPSTSHGRLIEARWQVPRVRAVATTRFGGISEPPFASFNLARHVGDDASAVDGNRQRLAALTGVAAERVQWLDQRHGRDVLAANPATTAHAVAADASFTTGDDIALAILVADCVPVLLASRDGEAIAAAHCGWRGTVAGVVAALVEALPPPAREWTAWLGPGICQHCYQVGDDVRDLLDAEDREAVLAADGPNKWRMDLPGLVARRLRDSGIARIHASTLCTHHDPRFFSYRRQPRTGRQAALIWKARAGE